MPLILNNGKKRAKIFPTNIWKLRKYQYIYINGFYLDHQTTSTFSYYLKVPSKDLPLQTQDINTDI